MEEVKYIPGDLVMTDGAPIGTKKGVVYIITASDPNRTLTLKDGTVNKGVVTLDAVTEEDKAYFVDISTWVKHIVPIPLTHGILWKNDMFLKFGDDEYHVYAGEFEVTSAEYTTIAKLQYVHQLQHLLFGLGLDSSLKV